MPEIETNMIYDSTTLTDDLRVRQAFSAVKFWPPNFFLETNSDYVKNLGSGEKTHLLAPRGTQGGYLGQRPYIHQKIRKIAVFTTFWKEKKSFFGHII